MNAKQIEVYEFYKKLHHEAVTLYQMPEGLMVLGDDVIRVAKVTSVNITEDVGLLPDDLSILSKLGQKRIEVKLIQYRNDKGEYDLPDIKRLKAEQEMDY